MPMIVALTDEEWEMAEWLAGRAATIARAAGFSPAEWDLDTAERVFEQTAARRAAAAGDVRWQRIAAFFLDGPGSIPWPD